MSIEKKHSQDRTPERPKVKIDTRSLLDELARKIAKEYGIDISQVKELISSKTESKLDDLKSSISIPQGHESINFEELQKVISGAKDVIEKASREEIETLKGNIESPSFSSKEDFYISKNLISENFLKRAQNPKGLGDNMIGASIGIVNSTESTIQLLYNIGAGIIKTPYHIYLIASGKGSYDGFKRII